MVFVHSKCIICDVNFVSRLSAMDDSKNTGLPLLWSKIFATFCNYFHLDPSTWDDILNFYLEVNDIPFCTHCRNTMALLVILEDKIQSIKTKYNDADNHNSNNKNTREILMERSKLKVEYKISKIIAAISYTILKNNDNNEDNYNDQPQSEESEEEVIYDPDIIHRISMLRKTIYKHFNPHLVLSDFRYQMRKRIKKNQPAQVPVSPQPAPETSPIVTVIKEEELSIMDVDVKIESVDFNYDEFEDKILEEEEETAAVKVRLRDGEKQLNVKIEMDVDLDNNNTDNDDPLYIPPSEFLPQNQHTSSSLQRKQNLSTAKIPTSIRVKPGTYEGDRTLMTIKKYGDNKYKFGDWWFLQTSYGFTCCTCQESRSSSIAMVEHICENHKDWFRSSPLPPIRDLGNDVFVYKDNWKFKILERGRAECLTCMTKVVSRQSVLIHIRALHVNGSAKRYQCHICQKRFRAYTRFIAHEKLHQSPNIFTYDSKYEYQQVYDDRFDCMTCNEVTRTNFSMVQHIKETHAGYSYSWTTTSPQNDNNLESILPNIDHLNNKDIDSVQDHLLLSGPADVKYEPPPEPIVCTVCETHFSISWELLCHKKEGCTNDWRLWTFRDPQDHSKLLYENKWPVNVIGMTNQNKYSGKWKFACVTCGQERQGRSEMATHIQQIHSLCDVDLKPLALSVEVYDDPQPQPKPKPQPKRKRQRNPPSHGKRKPRMSKLEFPIEDGRLCCHLCGDGRTYKNRNTLYNHRSMYHGTFHSRRQKRVRNKPPKKKQKRASF